MKHSSCIHTNKMQLQIKHCTGCKHTLIRATTCCRLPRHKHQLCFWFLTMASFSENFFFFLTKAWKVKQKLSLLTCIPQLSLLLVLKVLSFTCHSGLRLKHVQSYPYPTPHAEFRTPHLSQTRRVPNRFLCPEQRWSSVFTAPPCERRVTLGGCWLLQQTCWGCLGQSRSYCLLLWLGTSSAPGTPG